LRACADAARFERVSAARKERRYDAHEFGDSILIERRPSSWVNLRRKAERITVAEISASRPFRQAGGINNIVSVYKSASDLNRGVTTELEIGGLNPTSLELSRDLATVFGAQALENMGSAPRLHGLDARGPEPLVVHL
jgi:hypothetical protein